MVLEHASVEEMRRKHVEPIALSDCLEAFCSEETLEYSCDKCKKVQQAAKKLQIWRLPPILVRFIFGRCYALTPFSIFMIFGAGVYTCVTHYICGWMNVSAYLTHPFPEIHYFW